MDPETLEAFYFEGQSLKEMATGSPAPAATGGRFGPPVFSATDVFKRRSHLIGPAQSKNSGASP